MSGPKNDDRPRQADWSAALAELVRSPSTEDLPEALALRGRHALAKGGTLDCDAWLRDMGQQALLRAATQPGEAAIVGRLQTVPTLPRTKALDALAGLFMLRDTLVHRRHGLQAVGLGEAAHRVDDLVARIERGAEGSGMSLSGLAHRKEAGLSAAAPLETAASIWDRVPDQRPTPPAPLPIVALVAEVTEARPIPDVALIPRFVKPPGEALAFVFDDDSRLYAQTYGERWLLRLEGPLSRMWRALDSSAFDLQWREDGALCALVRTDPHRPARVLIGRFSRSRLVVALDPPAKHAR